MPRLTAAPATAAPAADEPVTPEPVLPEGRQRWVPVAIVGLALLVRLIVVWRIHRTYVPQTDASQFDLLASRISDGHGFGSSPQPGMIGPTALRAPLYPLFLGAVYVVFGAGSWTWGLVANAILGAIVVALLGVIASQLLGRRVALVAMVVAALHPAMVMTGSSLQLEPLLTCLCLAGLAAALQHRRAPRGVLWPIVAGACLGLGMLTREQAFFFLPAVAWLLLTAGGRGARWRDATAWRAIAATAAAAVLVVIPWTIRNAVQLHAFVPVTTSAGFGLVGTYNETSMDSPTNPAMWLPPYNDPRTAQAILDLRNPTEVRMDARLRELTFDLIEDHPTYPFKVVGWNLVRGFDLDGGDYTHLISPYLPYPPRLIDPAIYAGWATLLLAAIGACTRRIRKVPFAVWAIPLATTLFMVVTLPFSIRYRALLEPFIVLAAATALLAGYDQLRGRAGPAAAPAAGPAGVPGTGTAARPRRTRPLEAARPGDAAGEGDEPVSP
jgi:4-amino-4-deoxy-L-arabinose transferase-like glycosyltransferase